MNLAGRVGPVAEQDKDALVFRVVAQTFDRQTNGIADGGFFTCQTNGRFFQQGMDGLAVKGERGLQIGTVAKQDQANAIPDPAVDKLTGDSLGSRQAVHSPPVKFKVRCFHAAGKIHRHH